jgi:hypothetical protein
VRLEQSLISKNDDSASSSSSDVPSRRASSAAVSQTSSNTTLSYFLTPDDKVYVANLYSQLDQSKMWTLSTGTIVKKLEVLATRCVDEQ